MRGMRLPFTASALQCMAECPQLSAQHQSEVVKHHSLRRILPESSSNTSWGITG